MCPCYITCFLWGSDRNVNFFKNIVFLRVKCSVQSSSKPSSTRMKTRSLFKLRKSWLKMHFELQLCYILGGKAKGWPYSGSLYDNNKANLS